MMMVVDGVPSVMRVLGIDVSSDEPVSAGLRISDSSVAVELETVEDEGTTDGASGLGTFSALAGDGVGSFEGLTAEDVDVDVEVDAVAAASMSIALEADEGGEAEKPGRSIDDERVGFFCDFIVELNVVEAAVVDSAMLATMPPLDGADEAGEVVNEELLSLNSTEDSGADAVGINESVCGSDKEAALLGVEAVADVRG